MTVAANILTGLIALLHAYILILEMFLWTKPAGLRAFGQTLQQARASATLAANQGLYNGLLAAGLVWGLVEATPDTGRSPRRYSSSPACSWRACMAA